MKNENALSTERQPTAEEHNAAIAIFCSYGGSNEQLEMACTIRQFGAAKVVTVAQDFNLLANPE